MKKSIALVFGVIILLIAAVIAYGILFKKEPADRHGLSAIYDVSADGNIAYVSYDKGRAGIHLDGTRIAELPEGKAAADIAFTNDGKQLAYIVSANNLEKDQQTEVRIIDTDSLHDEQLFTLESIVTEIEFDPKNDNQLYYLEAAVFTNYSPIAGKRPHDFDVHSFDRELQTHTDHTNLKAYSMTSLQVASQADAVYVQMFDDEEVETADDVFASVDRIFEIQLAEPNNFKAVSAADSKEDIYDFVLLPEQQQLIYQAAAKTNSQGTFEYELFSYDMKTNETKQLTTLEHAASRPKASGGHIYFMADHKFGERLSEYHLYRMNVDGSGIEEVQLES